MKPPIAFTIALIALLLSGACATSPEVHTPADSDFDEETFLDMVQENTFRWFWEVTDHQTGLVPDRAPSRTFSSVAAIGFGLTAYAVGAERGWVTRNQARERTLNTLQYLWDLPQGPEPEGTAGHRGFFYHFLTFDDGTRFGTVELSSIDTGLLIIGALFAAEYFDQDDDDERRIRELADALYRRVEWDWMVHREPLLSMGWFPEPGHPAQDETSGFLYPHYEGYNEAMFLYILALGAPEHAIDASAWDAFTSTYHWADFYGYEHVNFPPLFGHQFSHVWIDFRDIQDAYMRDRGIDYFENSRRATLAQRNYAIANPGEWRGYGADTWGWTASDGPADTTMVVDGRERTFHTYWARGVADMYINDDGTLVPTAVGGSVPFAPEETIATLRSMYDRFGDNLFTRHGFLDAFNLTLRRSISTHHGNVVEGVGWFNDDYLGIDQGPILLMIENYRTGLIWEHMRRNEHIRRGLERAGFTGGWLE